VRGAGAICSGEWVLRRRRYASEEMRDILTTRRPNGEGVPPEGLPYSGAAEPRIPGHVSGAGSAGLVSFAAAW